MDRSTKIGDERVTEYERVADDAMALHRLRRGIGYWQEQHQRADERAPGVREAQNHLNTVSHGLSLHAERLLGAIGRWRHWVETRGQVWEIRRDVAGPSPRPTSELTTPLRRVLREVRRRAALRMRRQGCDGGCADWRQHADDAEAVCWAAERSRQRLRRDSTADHRMVALRLIERWDEYEDVLTHARPSAACGALRRLGADYPEWPNHTLYRAFAIHVDEAFDQQGETDE